uniref:Uncharacterized protein n=1 Tax=Panagrellus redivivus TaxID=6233 RepID=A0A7E4VLB4_PANRE
MHRFLSRPPAVALGKAADVRRCPNGSAPHILHTRPLCLPLISISDLSSLITHTASFICAINPNHSMVQRFWSKTVPK